MEKLKYFNPLCKQLWNVSFGTDISARLTKNLPGWHFADDNQPNKLHNPPGHIFLPCTDYLKQ